MDSKFVAVNILVKKKVEVCKAALKRNRSRQEIAQPVSKQCFFFFFTKIIEIEFRVVNDVYGNSMHLRMLFRAVGPI